jgi:hypothetical protein
MSGRKNTLASRCANGVRTMRSNGSTDRFRRHRQSLLQNPFAGQLT